MLEALGVCVRQCMVPSHAVGVCVWRVWPQLWTPLAAVSSPMNTADLRTVYAPEGNNHSNRRAVNEQKWSETFQAHGGHSEEKTVLSALAQREAVGPLESWELLQSPWSLLEGLILLWPEEDGTSWSLTASNLSRAANTFLADALYCETLYVASPQSTPHRQLTCCWNTAVFYNTCPLSLSLPLAGRKNCRFLNALRSGAKGTAMLAASQRRGASHIWRRSLSPRDERREREAERRGEESWSAGKVEEYIGVWNWWRFSFFPRQIFLR